MHKYNVGSRGFLAMLVATALLPACAGPAPKTDTGVEKASGGVEARAPARTVEPRAPGGTTGRDSVPLRDDAPLRYVVKKGDTLWDIAGHFLHDPWYWPELWYANPDIENPHLIYPGDVLELVWTEDGRPQVRRVERLSPKVRELPLDAAVPTIPIEAIRQFLQGPRLVTEQELAEAPYVVQFLDEHLIGGSGNRLYARRVDPSDGRRLSMVRPGDTYVDPETGEFLGYEAIPIGRIEIQEFGDISTARITRSYREALVGDRLLPLDETVLTTDFQPHAPDANIEGVIISVYDGVGEIGQYQIVTLNRGAREGLVPGHVLDVDKRGRETRDPVTGERLTLPPVEAGTLLVFKTEERVSFGLIMHATRAINIGDIVRPPE